MSRNRWTLVCCLAAVGLILGGAMVGPTWAGGDKDKGNKTEKKVTLDQVPAEVKATIMKEAGSNTIKEIEEISKDGKVVCFEAEWKADGKEIEIKVAPDGKLLSRKIETDDKDDDD
jgi:hypothetical protein